jgi:2-polyprenyl-6-methoxyphenol hydroxylase-like FAD-dependent oxidoreductase
LYAVGADGANSFLRKALDIQVRDLGFKFDWLVVDVVPKTRRDWNPMTWQLCDPKRPTTVVPGGPGRRRWEFMLLPGEQALDMNKAEVAWDFSLGGF